MLRMCTAYTVPTLAVWTGGAWRAQVQKAQEWDRWVEATFSQIDSDGSGTLSADELTRFLRAGELCLSEGRLEAALSDAHSAADAGEMTLQVAAPPQAPFLVLSHL